jgi:hypothetical protein
VRSTRDYQDRREAFLRWAAQFPRVLNPLTVLVWNTEKTCFIERRGVVVRFDPALMNTVIIVRRVLREARKRYRWDARPRRYP